MRTMLHGEAVIRAASHVKAFDHCVSTPRVQVSCTLMGRCENTEGLSCALTDTVRAFVRIPRTCACNAEQQGQCV